MNSKKDCGLPNQDPNQVDAEEDLQKAIGFHQAGKLRQAELVCQQILQIHPWNVNTLHLLGVIAYQVENFEIAGDLIGQAIEVEPNQSSFFFSLGLVLKKQGKLAEAVNAYYKVLEIDPNNADAYNNLGNILGSSGKLEEAVDTYRKALEINPNDIKIYNNLSLALKRQGKLAEAIDTYHKVLEIDSTDVGTYRNLGMVLAEQGELEEAINAYCKALEIDSTDAGTHNNFGIILKEQGKLEEAIDAYCKALEIAPGYADAYNNLGNVLQLQGNFEEAVVVYQKALEINPNDARTHNNLGVTKQKQKKLVEAIDAYYKALSITPGYADAYNNLGNVLQLQGNFEEAMVVYQKALEINSQFSEAHKNLGMLLLLTGEFEHGWKKYEWRWECHDFPSENRNFPQSAWDGTNLSGKSILVWTEQGIGDEIMFANMLDTLSQMEVKIIAECEERLVPLFQRSFPKIQFVSREPKPNPILLDKNIDYQVPIGSLAQWLRTDESQFPNKGPYLSASSEKVSQLRDKYEELTNDKLLVGISWKSINHGIKKEKSTILENWTPILSQPDCFFVNLQYGDIKQEIGEYRSATGILIYMDQEINPLTNLDDFAAQISALDLIISISNTTVHMSGALGKEVWTLLPYIPDWRWMLEREDTPWYPTMKLFRQNQINDWSNVFQQVSLALKLHIKNVNPSVKG
ncbi:MAG: tetratricopeptide repeat protein [Candidatus Poribacteria bacterium]